MKPLNVRKEFVRLRAMGLSLKEIAEKIGIAPSTGFLWEKSHAMEIGELRKLEMEALYKECEATTEARLRILHNTLDKVNEALEQVFFTNVPADRLVEMQLKLTQAIGSLYQPLKLTFTVEDMVNESNMHYPEKWVEQSLKDQKKKISPQSDEKTPESE
ncbi:MAG: helix-turn-helix domain-containing protein [Thermoguttaceae bacterium]|nr:helix-turn-helix domain-containing protein [Thermoguttaceae bacterium]